MSDPDKRALWGLTPFFVAANRLIGPDLTGSLGKLNPLFAVGPAVLMVRQAQTDGQLIGVGPENARE